MTGATVRRAENAERAAGAASSGGPPASAGNAAVAPNATTVRIEDGTVRIEGLTVTDPGLVELLRAHPVARWPDLVERVLAVGTRGLLTMGLGIDLAEVDDRVRRSVTEVTGEAHRQVEAVLDAARRAFVEHLDPEHRSSAVARALAEFTSWRDGFLQTLNPDFADSHTARFLEQVEDLLAPQGLLETRLRSVLDPEADGSALARLAASIDHRFTEIRDLIVHQRGREEEAERGTSKGLEFEDVLEELLRETARHLPGSVVERTGRTPGELSGEAVVGDFVVTLPTGRRIVVEAKNTARVHLAGKDGILAELDRAMANRRADGALCVSACDAFPREVGPFGVYGNRVLVVDDGNGTMTAVGLRWVAASLQAGAADGDGIDTALVLDRLQRLRSLARLFSSNRRSLTEIKGSVDNVQGSLEEMRAELLAQVDDLARHFEGVADAASVVDLRSAG